MRGATCALLCGALILAHLGVANAAPSGCGSSCVNNNDCTAAGSDCTRCGASGTCVKGYGCGANCAVDTDCYSQGACSLCYYQHCGSDRCGSACSSNRDCMNISYCDTCLNRACQPSSTPNPPVPRPTPLPPPPPNDTTAFGSLFCGSHNNCQTFGTYMMGDTLVEAQNLGNDMCGSGDGDCTLLTLFGPPEPCLALAVTPGGGWGYSVHADLGTAVTRAMTDCHKSNTNCFVVSKGCAARAPPNSRWGALACSVNGCDTRWADTSNGTGHATQDDARSTAVNRCNHGGHDCHLVSIFYDCMAMAMSPGENTWSISTATTRAQAEKEARANCDFSTGETCTIHTSVCVNPYTQEEHPGKATVHSSTVYRAKKH